MKFLVKTALACAAMLAATLVRADDAASFESLRRQATLDDLVATIQPGSSSDAKNHRGSWPPRGEARPPRDAGRGHGRGQDHGRGHEREHDFDDDEHDRPHWPDPHCISPIPEPSALAMASAGLLGLGLARRRRRD